MNNGIDPFGINKDINKTQSSVNVNNSSLQSIDMNPSDSSTEERPVDSLQNGKTTQMLQNNSIPANNNNANINTVSNFNSNNQSIIQDNEVFTQQTMQNNNAFAIMDEELIRAFVGDNYEKISKKSYNFAAFFFGALYLCYRRVYLYGAIFYLIPYITEMIVGSYSSINFIVMIVLSIILFLTANNLYMNYAKTKVQNIKQSNKNLSQQELIEKCKKVGGASVGGIFVGIVINIIFTFVFMYIARM